MASNQTVGGSNPSGRVFSFYLMKDLSFFKQKVKGIKIYSRDFIENDEDVINLYNLFKIKISGVRSAVSQKSSVVRGMLNNVPVVIKHYKRGGILRFINNHFYLSSFTPSRAKKEFLFLEKVRSLGVNAPKPIIYAIRGGFIYRNWLVTQEILNFRDFCNLDEDDIEKIRSYTKELARQIKILINNKIYHIDLHPGNVGVGEDNQIYIIDFDKAHYFKGSKNELRDKYIVRWRRAVIKHKLSELLSEYFCANLRDNFDANE